MGVHYFCGDIFASSGFQALAHGVNCAGAMGRGIAVEFKRRWPEMYVEYRRQCRAKELFPGAVMTWQCQQAAGADFSLDISHVFNLGTQQSWRSKARLEFVEQSVTAMLQIANSLQIDSIALPRIGAGLGSLPWSDVKSCLNDVAASQKVELFVFETFVPKKAVRVNS